MSEGHRFVDFSDAPPAKPRFWPTLIVPKAAIDREIERLADAPMSSTGRRCSLVAHPNSDPKNPSFAPGMGVAIFVLKPGEESRPIAANSTCVDMCIRGSGVASIGNREFRVERHDVFNTPSMSRRAFRNDGDDLMVRLSFSNAPLLKKLEVHYVDDDPDAAKPAPAAEKGDANAVEQARDIAEVIDLGPVSGELRGYEFLVDIETVESVPLVWPWKHVSAHLDKVYDRDVSYTGRHLYLLYNPATGRRMGTTHSFFATIAKFPPGKVDMPHRHTSAAINYYFFGHGRSNVMGQEIEWEAGDLHLSAPGFAVHHHASRKQGFCALTIQDHPLHIAMESLLWQERMDQPLVKLGAQAGFQTNIGEFVDS